MEKGKTDRIVLAHSTEIDAAKQKYPQTSQAIEIFRGKLRLALDSLRQEIDHLKSREDRELAMVLLVNEIHRETDEIFL